VSEELNRLEQLFDAALELASPEERAEFLSRACGGDTALRQRVEKLLCAHETAGQFLNPETPSVQTGLPFSDLDLPPSEEPGDQIGRYTLVERIGEGGCCVVYLAEQVEPVRRKVALKLIKAGMDTRQVVARFEVERQALALMDHPHIAKVFDAGVTPTGRPYFVMELLRGIPITQFCDQHRLTVPQRLALFMQVCHAVQHAHQKGIIHRDLKPSNILVTTEDSASARGARAVSGGSPDTALDCEEISAGRRNPHASGACSPKIIDFGIAKAMQAGLTDREVVTWVGQFVGTPAYMSPEQARMNSEDIDARADIYALGVLLYELLTGVTPFDKETLATTALDEIGRMIEETEPSKPSTRLQELGGKLTDVAKLRQTEPRVLRRAVGGDLDWIVMKALEKDRGRRHATANDLAEDIRRHLAHEPVLADPPSAMYRTRKFVRRHRVGVAVGAIVTLALVAGLCVALVGLQRALRAEAATRLERDRAQQAEARMRRERDRAIQAEADTRGILSLFDEKLGADEDRLALHYAAARLARERLGDSTNAAAVEFLLPLGRNLGRIGAWTNALEVYRWLNKAASWNCDWCTHTHAAAMVAGQPEASRQLCAKLVQRFATTTDTITTMQVGRAVLIDPYSQEYLPAGLDCARRAFAAMPNYPWCQIVQGMAEYRRGNWSEALKQLHDPERKHEPLLGVIASCFGAMARHQSGQTAAAREVLDRASGELDGSLKAGVLPADHWHYVVFGLLARAEAERLILGREVSPRVTAEFLADARQKWKAVRDLLLSGESLARQGKWQGSRDAYVQALDHPSFTWAAAEEESAIRCLSLQMSTVFARAGDSTNHQRLCRLLLALHPDNPSTTAAAREAAARANSYARACFQNAACLSPDQSQQALELVRFALAKQQDSNGAHPARTARTGGIAEYHAGDPERALLLLHEAEKDNDAPVRGTAMAYRAMVLKKLDRAPEAAALLQEAEDLLGKSSSIDSSLHWWDAEQFELALEQARQLVRASAR
jgi:serine/threonine protein kinase/tetratricopeptide (TPR) repeat protein